MGKADHGHFGGHHRIGRAAYLLEGGQQHLPHPTEHPHRQSLSHHQASAALIGGDGRIIGGIGGDFNHAHPMAYLCQITKHSHRIGARRILR